MSSHLQCRMCYQITANPIVRLVKDKRVVKEGESALKLMDWAEQNLSLPYAIVHVYVCSRCNHEDVKSEKYVTG